ncbi:MAG: hypothetical protein JST00_19535 [Deltaproteobacteria bacterium]|nr:hypothetical protein [Deltaproteobacteria bacterium]
MDPYRVPPAPPPDAPCDREREGDREGMHVGLALLVIGAITTVAAAGADGNIGRIFGISVTCLAARTLFEALRSTSRNR